jgi:hypothetical protein
MKLLAELQRCEDAEAKEDTEMTVIKDVPPSPGRHPGAAGIMYEEILISTKAEKDM